MPVLNEKFWPTLWCVESRLQTVLAGFLRSTVLPHVKYRRELFQLKDGGEVALDWLENGCEPQAPIVIILPGLTGTSQADYVKCLAVAANKIGVRTVVFNNRGLGGVMLKTPRTYCASNSEDFEEVLNYVHTCNPNVRIGATGISMGGLVLGNFLAAHQEKARNLISAAMLISVPWNVFKGLENIEKPVLNLMLNNYLASALCQLGKRMAHISSLHQLDDKAFQSRTIREFDSKFTVKQFGFKDVQDYYQHATLHTKLHLIHVPLFCLNAADDPFQPIEAIPIEEANLSENVAIMVTARGGHIGFLEGFFPLYSDQYISKVFSQFFRAVWEEKFDVLST
ncbi:phospholipase ABHD3 isoform X2 [Bacillus rossius redtenbacheri]